MDPEQIYQEVLQEEQQKGSAGPVAEGRAKAARARAELGSPHPKEPKWWPGGQPHLEGGGAEEAAAEEASEEEAVADEAPAAEEAAVEEDAAAEAPAEQPAAEEGEAPAQETPVQQPAAAEEGEAPAQETPVQQPAATEEGEAPAQETPVQQPAAAEAPAEQPERAQPAAQRPAAAAAVATAPAPAPAAVPTTGVSHGTVSGNRLRPEDAVTTEAQFDGQRAMYERRRLIDEVIQTGVPAAAAASSERSSSGALAVLYLIIPLLVIGFLLINQDNAPTSEPPGDGGNGPPADSNTLVAQDTAFSLDSIDATAGEDVSFTFDNQDVALHNFALFPDEEAATAQEGDLYVSPDVPAGSSQDISFPAPDKPGDYPFICEYHPATMTGTLAVK